MQHSQLRWLKAVCAHLSTLSYHVGVAAINLQSAECSLCLSFVHDAADQAK